MEMTFQCLTNDYQRTLATVQDRSVALLLTDPPFGINYRNNYTKSPHTSITGDSGPFSYIPLGIEAMRILRDNSAILVYTGWSTYPEHFKELKASGLKMREPYIIQSVPLERLG